MYLKNPSHSDHRTLHSGNADLVRNTLRQIVVDSLNLTYTSLGKADDSSEIHRLQGVVNVLLELHQIFATAPRGEPDAPNPSAPAI